MSLAVDGASGGPRAPALVTARRDPKVLLLYPPNQSWPGTMCKPNGSLAYPNLVGALRAAGIAVEVYDACVGSEADDLDATFHRPVELPTGLMRTGVSDARILEVAAGADVVGLTSIFTDQETMVLAAARLIKAAYPEKLVVAGGVNARSRLDRFVRSGVDLVCLSEAEHTLVRIVEIVRRGGRDFSGVPAVAWATDGHVRANPARAGDMVRDLDTLPMPAWDALPNARYWAIGRPHGGHFRPGEPLRYASMMTSLGCVFACLYCHIAGETEGSAAGPIGRFREKSDGRVLDELAELRRLGVRQVFVEDDTLLGKKRRALRLLRRIQGAGFDILDVNGVNVIHLFQGRAPDLELLDVLVEAGFRELVLPFESGSARIIRKYASNKWDVERHDIAALIAACKDRGLTIAGNYMLGYPDETRAEIEATIALARDHRSDGLDAANFFLVMPLPGTPLFDLAVAAGHLPAEFDPDRMNWTKANMRHTAVAAAELEELRDRAWRELNAGDYVSYKTGMRVGARTDATRP